MNNDINRITRVEKRGSLVIAAIADLHFGAITPEKQYRILYEQFVKEIERLPILDVITILGDIFDRRVMSDSDAAMYASLMMQNIRQIAIEKNATVVVIMGTKQHDADQLKMFYHYLDDPQFDIRIVETLKFEYIKGMKVLCIPELYGVDDSVYEKLLHGSGPYDMVMAHCTFEGTIYGNNAGLSRLFTIQDFSLCQGPILSGHVHTPGCYQSDFYYCGSPLRWKFGEEQQKGFMLLCYDLDSKRYLPYMVPVKSFEYVTVSIESFVNSPPEDIIKYIDGVKSNGIDYVRISISDAISNESINILKEYYRNDNTIKFKQTQQQSAKIKQSEATDDNFSKYSYLFDKSLSPYDVLAKYVNDRQNEVIVSADEIKRIIEEER